MYSYKQYKKIYSNKSYIKYVFNVIFKRHFYDVIKSSYLCLKFPFLYPRNRFSDRHYTNWKLRDKSKDIYTKWSDWSKDNVQKYIDKFGKESVFLNDKVVKSEYILKLATKKDRFLHWYYEFAEKFLGIFHFLPTYTELDAMDKGWRKRFGIQFCKELKEAIKKSPNKKYMKTFRIMQIKEKWGQFQCYVNGASPEVNRVIQKYEYLSQYVCISCGEDATKKTLGWISPYCDKCLPKDENWIWIDPVYGWKNCKHDEENKEKLKEMY